MNMQPVCDGWVYGRYCHTNAFGRTDVHSRFQGYYVQDYSVSLAELVQKGFYFIVIDGDIFNLQPYVDGLRDYTGAIWQDPSHPNAYLNPSLHNLIFSHLNGDATNTYYEWFGSSGYIG